MPSPTLRCRGLTRRDRQVVQVVWLGWSVLFVAAGIVSGQVSDAGSLVAAVAVLPLSLAATAVALFFRMR